MRVRSGILLWLSAFLTISCSADSDSEGTAIESVPTTRKIGPDASLRGLWINHSDPNQIVDMAVDAEGHLWTVGPAGPVRWTPDGTSQTRFGFGDGLGITDLSSVAASPDGGVWVAGPAGLAHFDGTRWHEYRTGVELPWSPSTVAVGADGTVAAVAQDSRLVRRRDSLWEETAPLGISGANTRSAVLDVAADGVVWAVASEGIIRWDGAVPELVYVAEEPQRILEGIRVGRDGAVWVIGNGLYRFDGSSWSGLGGPYGRGIDIAPDGSVWVGGGDVHRYQDQRWTSYQVPLSIDKVAASSDGVTWASGVGLVRFADGTSERLTADHAGCLPTSMTVGGDGTMWAICAERRVAFHDGSDWQPAADPPPRAPWWWVLTVDGDGQVWGAVPDGLYRLDGSAWTVVSDGPDWPLGYVSAIAAASDGSIWLGGVPADASGPDAGGILARWFDGHWDTTTIQWRAWPGIDSEYSLEELPDGLPMITGIREAGDGSLWVSTRGGIFRYTDVVEPMAFYGYQGFDDVWPGSHAAVATAENDVWVAMEDHAARWDGREWTLFDNAAIGVSGELRAVTVAADGSVWVGTTGGAARFDGHRWVPFTSGDGLGMPVVDLVAAGPSESVWFVLHHGSGGYLTELRLIDDGPVLTPAATTLPQPTPRPTTTTAAVATTAAPPQTSTTVALPSTTTPAIYAVVQPEYQVAPLPGSGGYYGSGCTPGADTLPDGIWLGEVISTSSGSVEFDLMCFGPGPEGPGNISNTNPKLRTVSISPDAWVYRVGDDGTLWELISYGAWRATAPSPYCGRACPVWLYINAGRVTEIVELWFP